MTSLRQPGSRVRRSSRFALGALGLGLISPALALVGAPAAHAAPVTVTVLDFNDFHGRIDANTTKFATTIEQERAAAGEANTLLLSGGDNIGASLFASAYNDDKPTIDVLNTLDLAVSAVGNHEFDKGWPWFKSHVLEGTGTAPDGSAYPKADFPYLGANVLDASGNPVLPASAQFTVGGANVCVIGAVTQETPTLVSPGGIEGLTFSDPVAAVNKEVQRLAGAGVDCDATIADYHEGAPKSEPTTQAEQEAASAVFRHITQDTAAAVDVIYNAHTHQTYAYNNARPVVQAGSYAEKVGKVTMTIDPDANTVSGFTATEVARAAAEDLTLPRVAAVKQIVDTAIAESNEIGNRPVGSITADITRANTTGGYTGPGNTWVGTGEDRGDESAIGDLVANALRDGLPADMGSADIGIVNPGGLRSDLTYAGNTATNPANTDGVVTFAEANAVLPFVNNIWTIEVTGDTLKKILEQQWQPAGASRAFLHLGLSDNVNVTRDPSRPAGDRITSIRVNGTRISATDTFTVCTFSFLGQGGDNFTAFTEGTAKDTGLIDRDLWIEYLKAHSDLAPDFARQQTDESGLPATVNPGQAYSFTVSTLNMKSLGAPENTSVTAYAETPDGQKELGQFPVAAGTANVSFTVPGSVRANSVLTLVANPTGTEVSKGPNARVTADDATMTYGTATDVTVTVAPEDATGTVSLMKGNRVLGTGTVSSGTATITLKGNVLWPRVHTLTAVYSGDGTYTSASDTMKLVVKKAKPKVTFSRTPRTVVKGRTRELVKVHYTSPMQKVAGKVEVLSGGRSYTRWLRDGSAQVLLKPYATTGRKPVTVIYRGSALNKPVKIVRYVWVTR